ncbi:hypothetical protein SAMN04488058_103166 [Deinococcus reticulitermitis]|uniref:Uncharacterized protein n=1 Tax=Deinococcus reticulitermitis TaxID=856736 RepID=A0A1H6VLM3_9DEIO|nr:hypothetical protein [Deinococcus reticulitermitis]SEJ03904.1 hypothetical protein SAMN04488058_103166 [Deinococcus reticulitermitis]
MRLLLLALVVVLGVVYATMGLRFGYLTLTETQMLNASGTNTYHFRTLDGRQRVGVTGSCQVRSGTATLRLYDPGGTQVAGQRCQKGSWSLSVIGGGREGDYTLKVELDRYTGSLNLNETREGE